jgi:hypothetical protein
MSSTIHMTQFYNNIRYEDGLKEGKIECCTEKTVSRDDICFQRPMK